MSFHGCVESISQTRITGWAHFLVDGKPAPVGLTLRFWNAGSVAPTSTHVRGDGVIGFVFELGAQYQSFTWAKFIDEFRAIEATFETDLGVQRWDVPLFISILKPYDNRTALVGKLRDYSLAPKPDGRIACFTMVYNEYAMLPLWARYYAKVFGAENLYVLDHGSDKPYEGLPDGITVISLPRDQFDNWLIARIAGFFQRFLLEVLRFGVVHRLRRTCVCFARSSRRQGACGISSGFGPADRHYTRLQSLSRRAQRADIRPVPAVA